MTSYRCYFLGEDGKIQGAEVIEAETDAAALEAAEQRLLACKFPSIEVWDRARRVGAVHPPPQAPSQNSGEEPGTEDDMFSVTA